MELTELTERLIILFTPGIIETFIYETYLNKDELSDRNFIINVVFSAFTIYSFTYIIIKLIGGESTFLDALLDSNVKINMTEIFVASILAIVFGFLELHLIRKTIWKFIKQTEKEKQTQSIGSRIH